MKIEHCFEDKDKVIILSDNVRMIIEIDRSEAWSIDAYIDYLKEDYGKELLSYTKYNIKERILDSNNNLLLMCDHEYTKIK